MNGTSTEIVSAEQCDISCPGDASENCGGNRPVSGLARRQAIQDTILLTVYVNTNAPIGSTITTTMPAFTTTVMTITTTAIVTSCLPDSPSCVLGASTTEVLTITSTCSSSQPTAVACVGGYCGNAWTFKPFDGGECSGEVIYVIEACSCEGGWAYQPKACVDDSCAGMTVYKPVKCTDDECSGVATVFQPEACESCEGGVYFTQIPSQSSALASSVAAQSNSALSFTSLDSETSTGGMETGSSTSLYSHSPASPTASAQSSESVVTSASDRLVAGFGWLFTTLVLLFVAH